MIPEDAIWILELIRNRDARTEAEKDAVNAAIEALKAQLTREGTTKDATSDLIDRQAAIDIERNATVDTNPSHFEAHQKFTQFMDDAEISSFGRWQWSNGFNTALTAVGIDLKKLPSAQPEPHWIPVSERLPETEEFVLASLTGKYRNTTFEHACEIADYADGEWCVYAYPHMSAEKCEELIEAWMPLPEAYKPNK